MASSQSGPSGFDIQDVLEIALRRWRWFAVGAVGGLVVGVALWAGLPRRYEATTSILVEPQGVPESYVRSTITLDVDQRMSTLQQRVTSTSNLGDLIDLIGRNRLDPSGEHTPESLMKEIRRNVTVKVNTPRGREGGRPAASVIDVRYEAPRPDVLVDMVTGIGNLFIAESHKARSQQAAATEQFLEKELARVQKDLSVQEQRIRDFRMEHLGALPDQLDANNRELDRLNESLRSNLDAQERLSSELNLVRNRAGGGEATGGSSVADALADARKNLIQARRRYTDEHPDVRALQAQVEQLQQDLAREGAEASGDAAQWEDPARAREGQAISLNLAARKREGEHLRERIAELQNRVEDAPKNDQALQELTRGYDTLKKSYELLLGNQHAAALSRNLEAAQMAEQFKVLRPPRTPSAPFFPDPLLMVPGGLAGGLVIALLLVVWAEFRTPAFHSVETLARRLGLPILAAIPELDREKIYDGIAPPKDLDWRLVVHGAPTSAAAEQYRGFAPHFLERESCRVILVTSAQPGDGKSVTCANIAWILASDVGRRVLLIDSDMRRPSQHRLFGAPRDPGLSEVLRGDMDLDVCTRSVTPNLSLLPAGTPIANPLSLLTAESFVKLCERAAESHELVMIDSPPILPVIDAKILRRLADMVVFVVRAGISPSGGVARSLEELRGAAGLVFNRVSSGAFRRYYYYDAYSHYEYADRDSGSDPT